MPATAARLDGMRQSIIREMTRLAQRHNAVNMAQGFPDFGTPPEIIAAAHAALDHGRNQYTVTWGIRELREAVAGTLQRSYGLAYDPETDVCITCGVTEGIIAAVMSCVNPGEEVIIIDPCHENYVPAVTFAGARPVFVPLEPPNYVLDADRIRTAVTPRTRAIILNTPHNPTGRVFNRQELAALAELCAAHDLIVITDEIYDRIVYDDHVHIPPATLDGLFERTITASGLGKTFAITGWRLGYVCAPQPLATAVRTVHDYLTICAPTPMQVAAVAALSLPDGFYARQQADYTVRRARMADILIAAGLTPLVPEGAYYMLSDFSRTGFAGDDVAFTRYLVEQVGIAVVPGSSFYHLPGLGKQSVRWAFPKKPETFDIVAARLAHSQT